MSVTWETDSKCNEKGISLKSVSRAYQCRHILWSIGWTSLRQQNEWEVHSEGTWEGELSPSSFSAVLRWACSVHILGKHGIGASSILIPEVFWSSLLGDSWTLLPSEVWAFPGSHKGTCHLPGMISWSDECPQVLEFLRFIPWLLLIGRVESRIGGLGEEMIADQSPKDRRVVRK